MRASSGSASTDRTLALLARLASEPAGMTLQQIAAELNVGKATTYRSLRALRTAGLVDQDEPRGQYRLGLGFLRMAFRYYESWDEIASVRPSLDGIARATDETAHYARLDGDQIVYLAKVSPPGEGLRSLSRVGGRANASSSGLGKSLLAQELLTLADVDNFIREHGPLIARTDTTLTTAPSLHEELELTRRRGFATDNEEAEPGIVCIAFPLLLVGDTRTLRSVSVAAVAHRTPLRKLLTIAPVIRGILMADYPGQVIEPNTRTAQQTDQRA